MIKNYMQVIAEKLIKEKHFRMSNSEFREDKVGFVITTGEGPIIVEIYNVNSFTPVNMIQHIIAGVNNLNIITSNPIDYKIYRIFISHDDIPDIVLKTIKAAHIHDVYNKKYMKPIHVNVDKKTITCYYDKSFPDYGILDILYENIDEEKWHERDRDKVLELDDMKNEDFKIEFATQKEIAVRTLIVLNIVVYIFSCIKGYKEGYLAVITQLGIKDNDLIRRGEFYRLVAPIFLHADALHVITNCYALYAMGPVCEKIYGNLKFLALYMVSGIGGFIFSFALTQSPSLGASGAVFGVLGAISYMGLKKPLLFKTVFGTPFLIVIAMNIALSFTIPNIDSWGHVGGFIAGFLFAGVVGIMKDKNTYIKKICAILLLLIFGGMFYVGFNTIGGISHF